MPSAGRLRELLHRPGGPLGHHPGEHDGPGDRPGEKRQAEREQVRVADRDDNEQRHGGDKHRGNRDGRRGQPQPPSHYRPRGTTAR